MKTINFKSFLVLLFSFVVILSCSKDEGIGPKGDKGDKGEQGTTGPKGDTGNTGNTGPKGDTGNTGPKGADGEDGVFSAIYSAWTDVNWNVTNNARDKTMNVPISTTLISSNDLRDKSIVLMYLKQYGTSSIYQMSTAGRWTNTIYSYSFGNGLACCAGFLINLKSTDGVDLTDLQYDAVRGNKVRYVILPLNGPGKNIDYKSLSYKEVCEMFNIPQ